MIGQWLEKLTGRIEQGTDSPADDRLAAAALLYEVARADGTLDHRELSQLVELFSTRWSLSGDDARQMLEEARVHAESVTDYHELVTAIRSHWSAEKRARLVHDMWHVAHADAAKHAHEEHVIRKVADLLYVPHSEFIRGKLNSEPGNN